MQTNIADYYPPVIKRIKEIRQIAKAEDMEFSKLYATMERSGRNMFALLADTSGIEYFENLLGVRPKQPQTLENRRMAVILAMNRRKMGLSELKEMLRERFGDVEIFTDMANLEMKITIGVNNQVDKTVWDAIGEILPLNIYFLFAYRNGYKIPVRYANRIRFTTVFYPRMNLPRLRLGGAWKLDGSRKLDGYDGSGRVNFYPVRLRVQAGAGLGPYGGNAAPEICFRAGVEGAVKPAPAIHVRASAVCPVLSHGAARARVPFPVACNVRVGDVRVYNKSRLGGVWKLDGSRKLDGGVSVL